MIRSKQGRSGFSIIELAVAIIIITILAGLLMVGLSMARARARNLLCQVNLRSVVTAALNYAQQNSSFLPPGNGWSDDLVKGNFIDAKGFDPIGADHADLSNSAYANNPFFCPDGLLLPAGGSGSNVPTSYAITPAAGWWWGPEDDVWIVSKPSVESTFKPRWSTLNDMAAGPGAFWGPIRMDTAANPSQFLVVYESFTQKMDGQPIHMFRPNCWSAWLIGLIVQGNAIPFERQPECRWMHNNRPNIAALDGSVGPVKDGLAELIDSPIGTHMADIDLPGVQRAARWFHPRPPAEWEN